MTGIDTNYLLSTVQKSTTKTTGNDVLGKDAFLKLLITQLQNQDPTSPMDDKEFISQMATFSSLEQMQNISTKLDSFLDIEKENKLINYSQFVGQNVTYHQIKDDKSGEVIQGNGVVSSVQFNGDSVYFVLKDGTVLQPGNISLINQSSTEGNSLYEASLLIGRLVTWLGDNKEELSAMVSSVSMKNGKLSLTLDDENKTNVTLEQIIAVAQKS